MANSILTQSPKNQKNLPGGQSNTPNAWATQQLWRESTPADTPIRAHRARQALARLCLYPTTTRAGDVGYNQAAANERAALVDIAGELPPDDLAAVYHLARLLLLRPGAVDVWAAGVDYVAVMG